MDFQRILALSFLVLPILGVVVSNIFTGKNRRHARRFTAAVVTAMQACAAAAFFVLMKLSGQESYPFSLLPSDGGRPYFALTPFGLVMIFCAGLVGFASVLTASRTIRYKTNSFTNLLMILLIVMTGICVARDLFTLYAFMEVTGITSFIMIAIYREDESLEGAFKYLTMSCIAGVLILAGLAFLFLLSGSLRYEDLNVEALEAVSPSAKGLVYASAALLLAGFCIKSGAAPFHNWLPDAYQSADSAVSILLSGIVTKAAGIYGLLTVARIFSPLAGLRAALVSIGLFSVAVGALLALRQKNFKRVCAYSSVSQMGYVILGIGAGTPLGFLGAAAHIFSHAAFKSTLFTNAAALREQTGTLDMDEMGGLQKQMPVTAFTSVIAFLSTAGIPPLFGFWSKFTIVLALWLSGMQGAAWLALLLSVLTGAYFLRLQRKVFFGKPKESFSAVTEVNGGIRAAEIMLTIFTVAGGIAYPFVLSFLGFV